MWWIVLDSRQEDSPEEQHSLSAKIPAVPGECHPPPGAQCISLPHPITPWVYAFHLFSLFSIALMHAVSESPAVCAVEGRVDDFLQDVLNDAHARKSLCVGWLHKRHSLWLQPAGFVMSFDHLLQRGTGIQGEVFREVPVAASDAH